MWRTIPVYAMVCVGGVAALSWEVLWQLEISIAIGISAVGTAITLACLMGGMTAGSLLAGRWLRGRRVARPLRLYGALELAIGLAGLLLAPAFAWLEYVDSHVYGLVPGAAPLVHLVGVVLILAVPTSAMGASLPVFKLVALSHGTSVGFLYGCNTFGAALGVLVSAFVLIPWWGVQTTAVIVATLNGLVFLGTFVAFGSAARLEDEAAPSRPAALTVRSAASVAFLTGAATFAVEVIWFRALRSAFRGTTANFAAMLFAVLVALAVAARLGPWFERRFRREGVLLLVAGALVLIMTPVIERADFLVPRAGPVTGPLARVIACLLVMGPPIVFLGALLPWLLDRQSTAARCGSVYAANTLGAIVGSLGAAWVLLPAFGIARSSWLVAAAVGAAGLALMDPPARRPWAVVGGLALAFAVSLESGIGRDRVIGAEYYGAHRVLEFREGPDVTTSVIEVFGSERGLFIDGFAAAGEWGATRYMEWMGRLPMLLHEAPRNALVICFGTGQTANAVRREGAARLQIVDVNPAVYETAWYFAKNEGVLKDPQVSTQVMDGRAWLRRTSERYDVITLEPMPPNHAGVNSLYSIEFYDLVQNRLHDGGVAAQWLPAHLVTTSHARSIAATFRAAFPDAILWVHPEDRNGILIGSKAPADRGLDAVWPGLAHPDVPRSLTPEAIVGAVLLSAADLGRYAGDAPVVTDDNQLLAYGEMLDTRTRGPRSLDEVYREFLSARLPSPAPRMM
jgi:spermidine synthase